MMRPRCAAILDQAEAELDREIRSACDRLPKPLRAWLHRLNDAPASRRVPAGLALMAGGVFSFLPILGIWMLPVGAVLVAKDIPPLRRPSARMLAWVQRKLPARRRSGPL
jgi:hypothetical protein